MAVKSILIEDGVVDIVFSPDDGGYYVQRTIFSEKRDQVSKRIYNTADAAEQAYAEKRVRWE